jgi:hypothetical protein
MVVVLEAGHQASQKQVDWQEVLEEVLLFGAATLLAEWFQELVFLVRATVVVMVR